MSCCDVLPLFFDNDRTDSVTDRERMVGCHSSRQGGALSRRKTLEYRRVEHGNGLGDHCVTCKEHADCLYSRQTHGMSLVVPIVYGHLSPVAFSSSVSSWNEEQLD